MTAAITIHFRDPRPTLSCIKSLLEDGWSPILVWDNSSDAGVSLDKVRSRYESDSRVRWAGVNLNLGFGKGMNAALAELRNSAYSGPALLVNNDARALKGTRAALQRALASNGELPNLLIAPRIQQGGRETGWLFYHPWLALVTRYRLPGSFAYLSGCCLLVDRVEEHLQLFDEDFFMYGEDVELSWRVRNCGGRLILLDSCHIDHDGSASSGQASDAYERYLVQSHWILARKLAPNSFARLVMQSLRIPSLLTRACIRTFRLRSTAPIRAIFASISPYRWR